jgi:hypothetical protein
MLGVCEMNAESCQERPSEDSKTIWPIKHCQATWKGLDVNSQRHAISCRSVTISLYLHKVKLIVCRHNAGYLLYLLSFSVILRPCFPSLTLFIPSLLHHLLFYLSPLYPFLPLSYHFHFIYVPFLPFYRFIWRWVNCKCLDMVFTLFELKRRCRKQTWPRRVPSSGI